MAGEALDLRIVWDHAPVRLPDGSIVKDEKLPNPRNAEKELLALPEEEEEDEE